MSGIRGRRFCPACGTSLFDTEETGTVSVAVGAFGDPAFPAPTVEVYAVRRHRWVRMPGGIVTYPRDPD